MSAHPITTTWTSGGVEKKVTTYRNDGEQVAAWIDRHFTDVRALMATFPPDP